MIEVRPSPDGARTGRPLLLGSAAARSCPVKTHNAHDLTVPRPVLPAGPVELPERVRVARAFEAQQLEALIEAVPGLVVDLRLLDVEASAQACRQAMTVGAQVIVGGTLPADPDGHRVGRPDLLVRGLDRADGRPGYHPGEVKAHKVLLPTRRAREDDPAPPVSTVGWTPLAAPRPLAPQLWDGVVARLGSREGDFLQLAHYRRMLEAAGFAADRALGALLGTDTLREPDAEGRGQGVTQGLAWFDLAAPVVRTFSRSAATGWRLRSLLERYDHEQGLRVDVARTADRRTGDPTTDPAALVAPVVQRECATCVWWPHCRAALPEDEVSLRIDKGALDVREVLALRRRGVRTVPQLASVDVDALLPAYLPEVSHRAGTENRLRVAARRARMLVAGVAFDRETSGPIVVPGADLEIDLDIESAADGRIYLWGFLVHDAAGAGPPQYRAFARFADLDDGSEAALAAEAFDWLRELVETGRADGGRTVRVYHYSAYEPSAVRALAEREGAPPVLTWAAGCAGEFVDLYETVKTHLFGAAGLGLKPVAQHAGFRWRDDDPGGLNSQVWFAEAVHDPDPARREQARVRVLEYNEDDVLATHALRAWLRAQ